MKLTALEVLSKINAKVTRLHKIKAKQLIKRTGTHLSVDTILVLHFAHNMTFEAIENTITEEMSHQNRI